MKNTTKCEIVKYDKKEAVKKLTESRRLEEVNSLFNFQGFLEENLEGDHGGVAQLGEHLLCKQGVHGFEPRHLHQAERRQQGQVDKEESPRVEIQKAKGERAHSSGG